MADWKRGHWAITLYERKCLQNCSFHRPLGGEERSCCPSNGADRWKGKDFRRETERGFLLSGVSGSMIFHTTIEAINWNKNNNNNKSLHCNPMANWLTCIMNIRLENREKSGAGHQHQNVREWRVDSPTNQPPPSHHRLYAGNSKKSLALAVLSWDGENGHAHTLLVGQAMICSGLNNEDWKTSVKKMMKNWTGVCVWVVCRDV